MFEALSASVPVNTIVLLWHFVATEAAANHGGNICINTGRQKCIFVRKHCDMSSFTLQCSSFIFVVMLLSGYAVFSSLNPDKTVQT
jgi:hypothetical protein